MTAIMEDGKGFIVNPTIKWKVCYQSRVSTLRTATFHSGLTDRHLPKQTTRVIVSFINSNVIKTRATRFVFTQ